MRLLSLLGCFGAIAACQKPSQPVRWEHGWKTDRVTATRYRNETMGYNIGLTYPKNPYDCDRAEIGEFIESHDGWVFEGGGSPGAPMYVKFKGITDKESADKKLLEVLPGLDRLMRDISNGVAIKKLPPRKILDKTGKQWPECVPPDPKDPFGEFNNNLNSNGVPYKCSADGRWTVDVEAQKRQRESEDRQADLLAALTRRKLSHDEMMRVNLYLNVQPMQSFFACDKYAELYGMLVKQWELQMGQPMPLYIPLSAAKGEYNRCPQEEDNKRAVESLIGVLQKLSK